MYRLRTPKSADRASSATAHLYLGRFLLSRGRRRRHWTQASRDYQQPHVKAQDSYLPSC
jgi:hypothetical protein